MLTLVIALLLAVASFLYSSVGHGGASSYIAILVIFGFATEEVRIIALILNIIVSFIAFISFKSVVEFPKKLFLILILFSVPSAFLGGTIALNATIYYKILGVLLLLPTLRLFNLVPTTKQRRKFNWWIVALSGAIIGFISGIIGIGGGIMLSPLLLFLGWASVKQTASVSALFIFVNSIAGLLGASTLDISLPADRLALLPLAIVGGVLGSYIGAKKLKSIYIVRLLGLVLLIASIKFLVT